jgi:hypothetical protein
MLLKNTLMYTIHVEPEYGQTPGLYSEPLSDPEVRPQASYQVCRFFLAKGRCFWRRAARTLKSRADFEEPRGAYKFRDGHRAVSQTTDIQREHDALAQLLENENPKVLKLALIQTRECSVALQLED